MGGQFLAGLASLIALGDEPRALLLPSGEQGFGVGELGSQRIRGHASGFRVLVLARRLLVQGPRRISRRPSRATCSWPAARSSEAVVVLSAQARTSTWALACSCPARAWASASLARSASPSAPAASAARVAAASSRCNSSTPGSAAASSSQARRASARRRWPVGQALRVALAVLGLIELGAAGADLSLAGAGRRGGGLGQPGDPGGIGQRVRVARRRGGVSGGRVRVARRRGGVSGGRVRVARRRGGGADDLGDAGG